MLAEFFKDIFQYHHHINQQLIDELKKHQQTLPERSIPLFCHCINAHHIWNSRIISEKPAVGVHEIHTLEELKKMDKSNNEYTLRILDEVDLEKKFEYQNSKGKSYSNSVKDILFHICNHFTHHKGQIIADFRSKNIQPLITDYIFYKRSM